MHVRVLTRRVGLVGDGWARRVAGAALAGAGCEVIALDDPLMRDGVSDGVDVVVVVADDVELVRAASRPGAGCVQVRSTPFNDDELVDALLAGADGVVSCSDGVDDLCDGVRIVAEGGVAIGARDMRRALDVLRRDRGTLRPRIELTARQRSVLELIVRGESVKQTARTLGIAVKTVENTQSRLYRRLGVRNRSQAVAVAMRSGLVTPPEPA